MRKTFMLLGAGVCIAMQAHAQTMDTVTELEAGTNIVDLAVSGGHIFATAGSKVYSSADGTVWSPTAAVPDFVQNSERPRHMLAASDGSLYVAVGGYVGAAALGGGIMKTTDNGASWQTFPEFDMGGYDETGRIIEMPGGKLLTYSTTSTKNYHGTLSGSSWTRATQALMLYEATKYADTLVASTTSGMKYSLDMGDSWSTLTLPASTNLGRFGSAVFHNTATHRFGGSWQNFSRAAAGSVNFTDLNPNLASETPSYYPKQILSDWGGNLFMTYADAAGNCYIEKSTDNGATWTLLKKFESTACFTRVAVFGDDIIGAAGSRIIRISNVATPPPPAAIGQGAVQQVRIELLPNPATNTLCINNFAGALKIYAMTGACVRQLTIKGAETLDISDLSRGMYIITGIGADGTTQQQKFIKQ